MNNERTNGNTSTPQLNKRPAAERGQADHGWLQARHSFSFAGYYDPAHMGFRSLRVINEDTIGEGRGFGSHPHESMEIFTYLVSGQLEHKDNMGNGRIIHPGEFQYMSAGSGVVHSEFNPSPTEPAHLLQIWIEPEAPGGAPRYQEMNPGERRKQNGLTLLASPDGKGDSIAIRQQAEISFGQLDEGNAFEFTLAPPLEYAWLQLIEGNLEIGGQQLTAGDGLSMQRQGTVNITSNSDAEFLLFRLA